MIGGDGDDDGGGGDDNDVQTLAVSAAERGSVCPWRGFVMPNALASLDFTVVCLRRFY